jgi:hypothetical protein
VFIRVSNETHGIIAIAQNPHQEVGTTNVATEEICHKVTNSLRNMMWRNKVAAMESIQFMLQFRRSNCQDMKKVPSGKQKEHISVEGEAEREKYVIRNVKDKSRVGRTKDRT